MLSRTTLTVAAAALMAFSRTCLAIEPSCTSLARTMNIVAHEDDDLLFLSPDLLHDVRAGHCVRTVYVTAGDAGKGMDYVRSRELGIEEAYATMAQVESMWGQTTESAGGRSLQALHLLTAPRISIVFLHLPDGDLSGGGFPANHFRSLRKLRNGTLSALDPVDSSSPYTLQSLKATLNDLINSFQPMTVRVQDWRSWVIDHSDHKAVASIVHEVSAGQAYDLISYTDDAMIIFPANLDEADRREKSRVFDAYARHDTELHCFNCWYSPYSYWVLRQYVVRIPPRVSMQDR